MKNIGFIDYYISEWHADNYVKWIDEITQNTDEAFEVKYVWAEKDISPVDGRSTRQWCMEHGTEKCSTIEDLCEKSDFIIILSPSNPEKHIEYAKIALKFRKNTYIDKTFAQNYSQAKEIYALAERYGTNIFSSSALRYASELEEFSDVAAIITTGGGSNPEEYIIHQIEMIVKLLKTAPIAVKAEKLEAQYIYSAEFEGNKKAAMIYAPSMPFTVCAETKNGSEYRAISSPFFKSLIADILRFFKTGTASFDSNQTLSALKFRDGIIEAMKKDGSLIKL